MNTKDLAKQVADQLGTTEKQARELLDAALNAIGQAAAAGDEINLPGFGKFKVKSMSERSGRNPGCSRGSHRPRPQSADRCRQGQSCP